MVEGRSRLAVSSGLPSHHHIHIAHVIYVTCTCWASFKWVLVRPKGNLALFPDPGAIPKLELELLLSNRFTNYTNALHESFWVGLGAELG